MLRKKKKSALQMDELTVLWPESFIKQKKEEELKNIKARRSRGSIFSSLGALFLKKEKKGSDQTHWNDV